MLKQLKIFYIIVLIIFILPIRGIWISSVMASSPISPSLGEAEIFGILANTYVNGVIWTTINGDIGYVAPPWVAPTSTNPPHANNATYALAATDQSAALLALDSQACTFTFPAGAIELSTAVTYGAPGVYTPGIYCASAAASITTGITLSGSWTYIFRVGAALTSAASTNVLLTNGASADHVWWTAGWAISLGANSTFIWNSFSDSITLGADVLLTWRTFAAGGTVTTWANSIITVPIDIIVVPVIPLDTSTCTSSLGAANTFGILTDALFTSTPSTTINWDIWYTTISSTPAVNGTTYAAPNATYDSAIVDRDAALDVLNSQECDYTSGAAVDLFNDATHYTSPFDLGSLNVYTPGVYCITGAISISGSITLSGTGVYVFKTPAAFTTGAWVDIILSDGALANDIFWVWLSTTFWANVDFSGTVLTTTAITLGADNTINGRLFSSTITTAVNSHITVPTYFFPPDISHINFSSWSLLPWWYHNLVINYSDESCFWINMSSDIMALYKWDWTTWWSDISPTWLDLWSKLITATGATYPTDSLDFWKYKYDFTISDTPTNSSSTWSVFYIDIPEIIVSTWGLDIGDLSSTWSTFSWWEITVTIKTVGAAFDLILDKSSMMQNSNGDEIIDWDGSTWIGYDADPYSNTIKTINTDELLTSEWANLNLNGDKNIYTYNIKMWSLIDVNQVAGIYETHIDFHINLDY